MTDGLVNKDGEAIAGYTVEYQGANFTAESRRCYVVDTSGGAVTATLPAGAAGIRIKFVDAFQNAAQSWSDDNFTITPATGESITGFTTNESLVCDIGGAWVEVLWDQNNGAWALAMPGFSQSTVDASTTEAGLVSTGTQTFAGIKNNASMPAFRAIPSGTFAHYVTDGIVKFNSWTDSGTDAFDQGGNFASSRFTVPTGAGGVYAFQANMGWDGGAGSIDAGDAFQIILRKNGAGVALAQNRAQTTNQDINVAVNTTLSLVAGDYIEVYLFTSSGTNVTTLGSGYYAWFSGHKLY